MSAKEILKMGNPLLREVAENFSVEEIKSLETKDLLKAVSYTHLTLPTKA